MTQKVAILGSRGFLGQYFCGHLQQHYQVVPVDRGTLDLLDFVSVQSWLKQNNFRTVINCACAGVNSAAHLWNSQHVQNNLAIFLNFYNNHCYFDKFINIGSGAEYDRSASIMLARESDILVKTPRDSYGYSKNVMARISMNHDKFHTLRVFGCFDATEPDHRLFRRILNREKLVIEDKNFDFISARDLLVIVRHVIDTDVPYRDINCVYREHPTLWQTVVDFCNIHNISYAGYLMETSSHHYTGNADKLSGMNLPLEGLQSALEQYQ
jgi:nucleoside-diphosphate-sugar epimerase